MKEDTLYSIGDLLSNLKTEVQLMGINSVEKYWRDTDYIPSYNKIYYIQHGEGYIKIEDETWYPTAGDIIIMPQGIRQSYGLTNHNNPFYQYWIHFTALVGDVNLFDIIQVPYCIHIEEDSYICSIFQSIYTYYYSNKPTYQFTKKAAMNALLLQLICYVLEQAPADTITTTSKLDVNRLLPVISYIDHHLSEDLSLSILAEQAHLQPNYFINLFHKYIGVTPMKYVTAKRMECAVHLLCTTPLKIREVANHCGFQDELYFSKLFKRSFSMTPNEFRLVHSNTSLSQ